MSNTIKVRRGTETNLPILEAGEFGFCTDSHKVYIGDGSANHLISGSGIGSIVEDSTPQLGGELDAQAHSIGFTQQIISYNSGTTTVDWKLGNKASMTFGTGNIDTFAFTNPSKPCSLLLKIVQDSTGGRTITNWDTDIIWMNGSPPVLSTPGDSIDIISFYFDGTKYDGASSRALENIIEDATPQLGGDLDTNGHSIGEITRYIEYRLLDKDTDHTVATTVGGELRVPKGMTVLDVGAYIDTAGVTGTATIDINEAGTSILSTKITIDTGEKSSETAVAPPVISDSAIATDAILTFDIDVIQTTPAKGLVVWLEVKF